MDPKSKPFQPLGVSRGPRPGLSKSAGLARPFKPPMKQSTAANTTISPNPVQSTAASSASSSKTITPKTNNAPARKNSGKRKNKKPRSENARNVGEATNNSGDQGHTKGTPARNQKGTPSSGNNTTKAKQTTAGAKEKQQQQQPSKKTPKPPSVKKPSGNKPSSGNKAPKNKQNQISKTNMDVLKRVPDRFPSSKTDLYVSRNSDFSVQLGRAEKLFLSGQKNVCIHGLGAAINRAINLSLQLQMRLAFPVMISTTTSTVPLIDDLIPSKELLLGNQHEKTQIRNNSAIHIVLQKTKCEEII